jgi:site-specific recombinase XerD
MQTKISILFFIKRSKPNAHGLVPIYMRLTVNGQRLENSTSRFVNPDHWAVSAGKVKPGSGDAKSINTHLELLKKQAYDFQAELMLKGMIVNTDNLRNKISGAEIRKFSLLKVFQDHNDQIKALVGQQFAPGTLERYKTSLSHTIEFIKWKFNVSDIDIRSVDHAFITEYEFYLRSVRKCNNNSAVKYIKNFGKIIRICLANGWIDKNPFINYKAKVKIVDRVFLTEVELHSIINKQVRTVRLKQIQDVFVFCCFTGLAYADVKNLRKFHIVLSIEGDKKIVINRQKTGSRSVIPLLPIPEILLEKYSDDPQCLNSGQLLPVLSNQKVNEYLKELASLCGIEKEISFHTARHTFATMMLSNGVPIESLRQMLGHKDLKDTQHYAKILDCKIVHDMQTVKDKFKTEAWLQAKTGS